MAVRERPVLSALVKRLRPQAVDAAPSGAPALQCGVCGGADFTFRPVLAAPLIVDWQLSPAEIDYVERQQGESCNSCGANLRSVALADAIRSAVGTELLLGDYVASAASRRLKVLEINEAGTLTPTLKRLEGHVFGAYPELDMHEMPYADETFDLIVHSDTLEHVPNPVHALAECRRVLKRGGALCFTVPIIVGRMSRDRTGMKPSYHSLEARADMIARTEFGADAWTYVMQAGFNNVALHAVEYPCAIAITAKR
jgi:SAM-dependent methyltransferase